MMLNVRVAGKRLVAEDICAFELVEATGRTLPAFAAGAHIDVHLPGGIIRQYSLCNDPNETHRYVIGVLKDPRSRGGSIAMHELAIDARLQISEPRNLFPLAHGAQHSILVAGGIGITPLLCMAQQLANQSASFELHYCARSFDRIAFRDELRASAISPHVFLHVDDDAVHRFDGSAIFREAKGDGTHVYVCGPGGFIDGVLGAARSNGYADRQLHREYFAAVAGPDGSEDRPFQIRIASSGEVWSVGSDETVISVLARHGVDIPTSCEQGVCGTCVVRVLDGTPLHRDVFMTDEEHAANDQFTPCCSRSCSPVLVLDI